MQEGSRAIRVQAAVEYRRFQGKLAVSVTDSGHTESYVLVDDGSVPGDSPMDGLWTAYCPIGPGRFFDVALKVLDNDDTTVVYHRVVTAPPGDVSLDFYVETTDTGVVAHRVIWLPAAGDDEYFGGALAMSLAFGWGLLVLAYVFFLIVLGRRR